MHFECTTRIEDARSFHWTLAPLLERNCPEGERRLQLLYRSIGSYADEYPARLSAECPDTPPSCRRIPLGRRQAQCRGMGGRRVSAPRRRAETSFLLFRVPPAHRRSKQICCLKNWAGPDDHRRGRPLRCQKAKRLTKKGVAFLLDPCIIKKEKTTESKMSSGQGENPDRRYSPRPVFPHS